MTLALVTFDLHGGERADYDAAYSFLNQVGFETQVISNDGQRITLPNTTCTGTFGDVVTPMTLLQRVQAGFRAHRLSTKIFVLVNGSWAYGQT